MIFDAKIYVNDRFLRENENFGNKLIGKNQPANQLIWDLALNLFHHVIEPVLKG